MASQDRSCKYIGSLTEGPSLTSGCGMACCPWTAYACKERTALRRVWQCHTQWTPISISPLSLMCNKNKLGTCNRQHQKPEHSQSVIWVLFQKQWPMWGWTVRLIRRQGHKNNAFTWPPAKMTGEPEGLGLYGMVTPLGGDWKDRRIQNLISNKSRTGNNVSGSKSLISPQAWRHKSAWHTQ